ncbi:hypothetical protein LL973_02185 [Xanthomonas campestris pv. nigromaculans]|nr:hypothetical protein [Xanthomonas campestris pv. nigromaculans]
MKEFIQVIAVAWAICAVISICIIGFHYLASPWDWVCTVFLMGTICAIGGYFMGANDP